MLESSRRFPSTWTAQRPLGTEGTAAPAPEESGLDGWREKAGLGASISGSAWALGCLVPCTWCPCIWLHFFWIPFLVPLLWRLYLQLSVGDR